MITKKKTAKKVVLESKAKPLELHSKAAKLDLESKAIKLELDSKANTAFKKSYAKWKARKQFFLEYKLNSLDNIEAKKILERTGKTLKYLYYNPFYKDFYAENKDEISIFLKSVYEESVIRHQTNLRYPSKSAKEYEQACIDIDYAYVASLLRNSLNKKRFQNKKRYVKRPWRAIRHNFYNIFDPPCVELKPIDIFK